MSKIVLKNATVEESEDGTISVTTENNGVKIMYEVSATFEVDVSRHYAHIAVHLRNVTPKDDDIPM